MEEEIALCETEILACEAELAHFKSAQKFIRFVKLIEERRAQLKAMTKDWEKLALFFERSTAPMSTENPR